MRHMKTMITQVLHMFMKMHHEITKEKKRKYKMELTKIEKQIDELKSTMKQINGRLDMVEKKMKLTRFFSKCSTDKNK